MQILPVALTPFAAYRQFILYQLVPSKTRPNKMDKFPIDYRTGKMPPKDSGGAFYRDMWTDANTAMDKAKEWGASYGVGFVLTKEDPFWFLDIDNCLQDDGTWSQVAQTLAMALPGAAVELSSSKRGLHLFGTYTTMPPHGCRNEQYGLEFYHEGRFVALTGDSTTGSASLDCTVALAPILANYFPSLGGVGTPEEKWTTSPCVGWRGTRDDDELLKRAMRSKSAMSAFKGTAAFADLWECNIEVLALTYPTVDGDRPYDASSADRALAQHLAFWTGKNCDRIKRMMQQSQLVRPKWDRDDYLNRTILGAVEQQKDFLVDKELEPAPGSVNTNPTLGLPMGTLPSGNMFLNGEAMINHFAGCVNIQDQGRILLPGGRLVSKATFNDIYGRRTFAMDKMNTRTTDDPTKAFFHSQAFVAPQANTACFRPDRPPGEMVTVADTTTVNVWWPPAIRRVVGDASPFTTHLHKLLPNGEDALALMSYMAACVQYRGYKIPWAPVIQGVEGNGKTLITKCLVYAIGSDFVHWAKPSQLTNAFNGWLMNKLLYAVEDVYVAKGQAEMWEELKPMIAGGDRIEIQLKGIDQISAAIVGNFIFNTNHKDGLRKTLNDRRLAMFFTAQQHVNDLKRDGLTHEYFSNFRKWLELDGYAIVAELLHTMPIPARYDPKGECQRAPMTTSMREAIGSGRNSVEQLLIDAIEQDAPGFAHGWISSTAVDKLLAAAGIGRNMALNKRRDLIMGLGYIPHPGLLNGRAGSIVLPDGNRPRLFVTENHETLLYDKPGAISAAYTLAQTVGISASVKEPQHG